MSTLIAGKGATYVDRFDLSIPPVPPATSTFTPIPHYDLANTVRTISQDILRDYFIFDERYVLAREGDQLFAVLDFKGEDKETALAIGYRSSYDNSLALKLTTGASVFVCSNLMLSGDNIAVMKKHTKNLLIGLEDMIITAVYKAQHSHQRIIEDGNRLKNISIEDRQAARLLGQLFWDGIISPRQVPVVRSEWLKPSHEEFQPRTAFSFYNCCNHALKTNTPISQTIERHITLHKVMTEGGAIWS